MRWWYFELDHRWTINLLRIPVATITPSTYDDAFDLLRDYLAMRGIESSYPWHVGLTGNLARGPTRNHSTRDDSLCESVVPTCQLLLADTYDP